MAIIKIMAKKTTYKHVLKTKTMIIAKKSSLNLPHSAQREVYSVYNAR